MRKLALELRGKLTDAKVPQAGRVLLVNGKFENCLLSDGSKLTAFDKSNTTEGLREAIIGRLAMGWLAAVCEAQEQIRIQATSWPQALVLLDEALEALERRFVGYGALWHAMDLIPELHALEQQHERGQIDFWSSLLRDFGCRWPEPELTTLVRYFYRTADVTKQCTRSDGDHGQQMWLLHRHWSEQLIAAAIAEPDPERVWQARPALLLGTEVPAADKWRR